MIGCTNISFNLVLSQKQENRPLASPEERKIFSVIHELGHLIFHRDEYNKGTMGLIYKDYKKDINEKVANTFANYFLIPREILKDGAYKFYFRGNRFFQLMI
jgi:Zn-dependent peptidase ImmA (M78 family)